MNQMTIEKCVKLRVLNAAEINVIKRHVSRHKWFRHIPTETEAISSFLDEFGPIMREMFCESCGFYKECEPYQEYLKENYPELYPKSSSLNKV